MNFPATLGIPNYEFRLVFGRTTIDYDLDKDDSNRTKHNYSLESAVFLLRRLILPTSTKSYFVTHDAFSKNNEIRHKHMTVDDNSQIVFMVTTMRPEETVRVISLRKASITERKEFTRLTGYVQP